MLVARRAALSGVKLTARGPSCRAGDVDRRPDFDVASLTKVVATATSVMILIERGQVLLNDPVFVTYRN